jgi:hypothetical protein
MIIESEEMKKLRNRQIFDEIKVVALKISDHDPSDDEEDEDTYEKLVKDILGEE